MSHGWRSTWSGAVVSAVAAAVLTVPLAWPTLIHPRSVLFGEPGDNYGTLAGIQALAERADDRPRGSALQPLSDLPTAWLATIFGPVAAYNLVLLAGFPLAAAAAYVPAFLLTSCRGAALLAALAFAFSPYHLAHAREHFDQSHVALLALVAWAALALVRRVDARSTISLPIALATAGLGNAYFFVVAAPLAIAAVLIAAIDVCGRAASRRSSLLVAMLVVGALTIADYAHDRLIHGARSERGDVVRYSARPGDYLRPSTEHPLFGAWSARRFAAHAHGSTPVEQTLNIGVTVLLLGFVGTMVGWRRGGELRRLTAMLVIAAALGLVSSLPPSYGLSGLWHDLCPPFRAAARFGSVVQLCLVLLAGIGACKVGRRGLLVAFAAIALEYVVVPSSHVVEPIELSQWLEGNATLIADYPPAPNRYLRRFRPLRAVAVLPPGGLSAVDAVRLDHPVTGARLAAVGVSHVVIHDPRTELPSWLREVARFGPRRVATVDAPPTPVVVRAHGGFEAPEPGGRWLSGGRGLLHLELAARFHRVDGVLRADVRSLGPRRRLSSGGERVEVGDDFVAWSLPATVGRDGLSVTLEVDPPGRAADDVIGNGDPRPLALLFRHLRFVARCEVAADERGVCFESGFEEREPDGRRWLGAAATLRLVGDVGVVRWLAVARGGQAPLRIRCGARILGERQLRADSWESVAVEVPRGCDRLELEVAEAAAPVAGRDSRFAIRAVEVRDTLDADVDAR